MSEITTEVARLEGLPRKNGELVFAAPWEGRVFGMALALTKQGRFEWEAFRQLLVQGIADDPARPYYVSWLAALERRLVEGRVVTPPELAARRSEYAAMEREGVF